MSAPTWTTDPPAEDGWYWVLLPGHDRAIPLDVRTGAPMSSRPGGKYVLLPRCDEVFYVQTECAGWHWLGPIEPPEPPNV